MVDPRPTDYARLPNVKKEALAAFVAKVFPAGSKEHLCAAHTMKTSFPVFAANTLEEILGALIAHARKVKKAFKLQRKVETHIKGVMKKVVVSVGSVFRFDVCYF